MIRTPKNKILQENPEFVRGTKDGYVLNQEGLQELLCVIRAVSGGIECLGPLIALLPESLEYAGSNVMDDLPACEDFLNELGRLETIVQSHYNQEEIH